MRRVVLLSTLLAFLATLSFAAKVEIPFSAGDVEVPFVVQVSKLVEFLPEDFDPDWTSLTVVSADKLVPFQIEDVDGNKRVSAADYLVFLAAGKGKIVLQDVPGTQQKFEPAFTIEQKGNKWLGVSKDGNLAFEVSDKGLVSITKFSGIEQKLLDEIGILRVSGWPASTYYVDGNLGYHHEETSGAFRVVSLKVLEPGPVAVGIVTHLKSEKFVGLNQILTVHVFKNGDVLVDNLISFDTYCDLMKLQTMVTRPVTAFDDVLHILPVFRRLVWADQLGITPYEYWLQRNAIKIIDNIPYIVFPAKDSMRPLWWGATYIFASMERFRSNFSPSAKVGVAEILPTVPVVYADYKKWLDSDTWVYESLEFRDGIFKWMPGEFEAFEPTKGVYSMKVEDMPNRYKAGDVVQHVRLYSLYKASDVTNAVRWIEAKSKSFTSIKIGE